MSNVLTETVAAPVLNDRWKARLLDGQQLELDKHGFGFHPALPDFDESVKSSDFFAVLGIELKASMAENEMDSDAYEAMTDPNAPLYDCRAWTPKRPDGDSWNLVAIFDTEGGPACWWMHDKPFEAKRTEGHRERTDNAAVEVLAMNMKAKLSIQRGKGYGGWNNACTQQHLSDLLRQCVDKGDPVDVANYCAFLVARGELIAPKAAAVAVPLTFMTEDRAREWAWDKVREEVGTQGWTAGESFNFHGFYLWGWNYRAQYELQRTATRSAVMQEIQSAAPAAAAPVVLPELGAAVKEVMALVDAFGELKESEGISSSAGKGVAQYVLWAADKRKSILAKLSELWATGGQAQTVEGSEIRWVGNGVIGARPTTHDLREAITAAEDSQKCDCGDCSQAQADAWDAERWRTVRDEPHLQAEATALFGKLIRTSTEFDAVIDADIVQRAAIATAKGE